MYDLITFCSDTAALVAELQVKLPNRVSIDEQGNPIFLIDKTPTVRNGNETLALIRLDQQELEELLLADLQNLTILGTYEQVFADPSKKSIYDRVYPRLPITVNTEDGEQTFVPPELFGVFA